LAQVCRIIDVRPYRDMGPVICTTSFHSFALRERLRKRTAALPTQYCSSSQLLRRIRRDGRIRDFVRVGEDG